MIKIYYLDSEYHYFMWSTVRDDYKLVLCLKNATFWVWVIFGE